MAVLGALQLLLLAGCGSAPDAGGSNVIIERWSASAGDPVSLDPAHAIYTLPQASIPYALFDQLTTYDPQTRTIVPMLAEKVSSNESGTEWTFQLRRTATWHDGKPVLPSDVKFAWQRVVAPVTASRWAALFSSIRGYAEYRSGAADEISGIVADDAMSTLKVELSEPVGEFPGMVTQLPFSPLPAHKLSALASGTRWDDQLVVGSGAFRMLSPWRHGREVKLVRYASYYGGALGHPANVDGIEFRIAKDVDASFMELEAGVAHIAFLPPSRYAELKTRTDLSVIDEPMSATWYLGFNMQNPLVGGDENRLLRRAIALAIDRQAIVDTVYQGGRRVGYTLTPPETPGYDLRVAPVRRRDVAAARESLAGWGGISRLTKPLRFIYNIGSGQENVAAIVKANLAEVGIPLEVQSFDSSQFPGEILKPETMLFRQLITYAYPGADAGLFPLLYGKSDGTNLPRYANPQVDRLLDAARATVDVRRRDALYAEAEAVALAEFAVIPVFHYKAAGVLANGLMGVRFMPSGYMDYRSARLLSEPPH